MTATTHLSDRLAFTLQHCGEPMRWAGSHTTWEGKPGQGFEITTGDYVCNVCSARVKVTLVEPA
jgi:hypothetical protein